MSGTDFNSIADGDWGQATIWDIGTVPDSGTDDVTVANFVTVGTAESFTAGTVSISGNGLLEVDGSLDVTGSLDAEGSGLTVGGTVDVAGLLTAGLLQPNSADFAVRAGTILVTGQINDYGSGTIASAGTLTNDDSIDTEFAGTLTLAPAVYQQGTAASLSAFGDNSVLILAPTGSFTNLSGGTLSDGAYGAPNGTLELPGPVTAIVDASVMLGGEFDAGGTTIAAGLTLVGSGALLDLGGAGFASANTITVQGGTLLVDNGTLDAPAVTVDAGSTLFGPGTITGNIENAGTIGIGRGGGGWLDLLGTVTGSGSIENFVTFATITAAAITLDGGSIFDSGSIAVTGAITMNGGVVDLSGGSLSAGHLVLATASTELTGNGAVTGSIENDGLIYASGGYLELTGAVSGSGSLEIAANSVLELAQATAQPVGFDPTGGELVLDQPGSFTGAIDAFATVVRQGSASRDKIDLPGFAPGTLTDSYGGTSAGGTLTIDSGTSVIASLALAGDYVASHFTLVPDGSTGTFIELALPPIFIGGGTGDWGNSSLWNTGTVPDNAADYALIRNSKGVSVAAGESFTVGTAEIGVSQSTLDLAGTLNATQLLTVDGAGVLTLLGGTGLAVAGSIDSINLIDGTGTLASSGTLTSDGFIDADQAAQTLTIAPAVYQGLNGGGLEATAAGAVLLLAPSSGAGGFADDIGGTLTVGTYQAINGGTLVLPAAVTDLGTASLVLEDAGSSIEAGGTAVEAGLTAVGTGELQLAGYDFVAANTLTVAAGGQIKLGGLATEGFRAVTLPAGTLEAPQLVLGAPGSGSSEGGELEGYGTVTAAISNAGVVFSNVPAYEGRVLDLTGPVTGPGSLQIGDASSIELGQVNAEPVTFDNVLFGALDALVLDQPDSYSGTIFGFTGDLNGITLSTDAVDLVGVAPDTLSAVYNGDTAGGALTISAAGAVVSTLHFSGDYTLNSFTLEPDGADGTDVAFVPPCYAAGARILTARGEVPVELLREGDLVQTLRGTLAPVRWIGRRHLDLRAYPRARPVRIGAGAFGEGMPHADLLVSPDHAIFAGGDGEDAAPGVLIPARCLVNGATIAWQPIEEVTYFHVELPRHEVLLANGLPAESYLDTGNRGDFANGGPAIRVHPDFSRAVWTERACAPLVQSGPRLAAVRTSLFRRAGALGHDSTKTPGLRLTIDGTPVAVPCAGGVVRLPDGARLARFTSRRWCPAEMESDTTDTRTLGVAITDIALDGVMIALAGPRLRDGWHAPEAEAWRWTDGDALLDVSGAATLAFTVVLTGIYWDGALAPAVERSIVAS